MDTRCKLDRTPLSYAWDKGHSAVISALRFESFIRSNHSWREAESLCPTRCDVSLVKDPKYV
jgi:hypothetical protein